MKLKKIVFYNFIYSLAIVSVFFISNIFKITDKIIRYINFETTNFKFQDLLSIGITILAIFVGAIITVATVLISMCDKRIMKLINRYGKSAYLVSSIKIAVVSGIISTCLFASVYARLDFNIFVVRLFILYFAVLALFIFVTKSKMLIKLVINILNDSFTGQDSIVVEAEFKKPKD